MAIVVRNTNYNGEVLEKILVLACTGNDLVEKGLIMVIPGVEKKISLPRIKTGKMLQKRKENPGLEDSKGNFNYSEKSLDPEDFMAFTTFNPRAFEHIWRKWQPKGNLVFAELPPEAQNTLLDELSKSVKFELGWHYINGEFGSDDDHLFNGILTQAAKDSDVIVVPAPGRPSLVGSFRTGGRILIILHLAAGIHQPQIVHLLGCGGTLSQNLLAELLEGHLRLCLIGGFQLVNPFFLYGRLQHRNSALKFADFRADSGNLSLNPRFFRITCCFLKLLLQFFQALLILFKSRLCFLQIFYYCRSARRFGQNVELTLKEFDLIELLMRNPGKVYSREQLLDLVWGYDYQGDIRTVDVHIRRLREKLERNPAAPEYIITKWGVGYYFAEV